MYPEQLPSRAYATVSFDVDWAYLRDLNQLCHRLDLDLETVMRQAVANYAQALAVPAVDVVRVRRRRRWGLLLAGLAGLALGVAGALLAVSF